MNPDEILNNPAYLEANEATKAAIRKKYGISEAPQPTAAQSQTQPQEMGWGDVAKEAALNLGGSTYELGKGLVQAVASPLDTAKSVLDLGAGILQSVLPESIVKAIGEDKQSQEVASNVGTYFKDRYGSTEGIKKAIAQDPAGVLADVSTILTGGAGAVSKVGQVSKVSGLTKAGEIVGKVAAATDPLNVLAKVTAAVAKTTTPAILGLTTGVGSMPLSEAYKAGREGGVRADLFKDALRGDAPLDDVVDTARGALDAMVEQKQSQYRANFEKIKNDKTILSFDDVDTVIGNVEKIGKFKDMVKSKSAVDTVNSIKKLVDDFKKMDPAVYHTPEGFDALKQQIWNDVIEKIPANERSSYTAAKAVYDGVKKTISKQASEYGDIMKEYQRATDLTNEIKRSLSLGEKSSAEAALRKLQSVMRNNVQTSYGKRTQMVKQLEEAGGAELMPQLAGQALSEWAPRGLGRAAIAPTGYAAFTTGGYPLLAAQAAASSPRLVGEASYLAGAGSRYFDKVPTPSRGATQLTYQAGKQDDEEGIVKSLFNLR